MANHTTIQMTGSNPKQITNQPGWLTDTLWTEMNQTYAKHIVEKFLQSNTQLSTAVTSETLEPSL